MLAPRASGAFVCLRCQLTRARPRLSALPRRAPHASFSSTSRRRDAAFDEETEREAKPQAQLKPQLSEHPLGRVRKRRGGRAIRETTARLEGTKTLGEDTSILVLEELGHGKTGETAPESEVARDDNELPLKLAEALADEKPATPEEVVEQLDRLRQKATNDEVGLDEGHYVSQTVYTRLSNHLLGAFTIAQLSHYYSERKGVEKDRVAQEVRQGLKQLQGKAKRPSERSEWTPGTTQIDRRLPSLDVHSGKRRKAIGKHLLVDQILRDVWKLVMLEELEANGEIELALKDWQLAMLTSGESETALDRIGNARKAKLEVDTADKVLRITADKHTAEYAADDVEHLLQASESHRFHLKTWLPHLDSLDTAEPTTDDVFTEDALSTVASLTGAQIQRSKDKIIIRALDKETTAEAERCLIKLLPLKSSDLDSVDITGQDVLKSADHLLPVVVEKEAVEYKVRNSKLGRWSLPINQASSPLPVSDSVSERVKTAQEQVLKMVLTPPAQYQRTSMSPKDISLRKWAYHPEVRLKARFGHVLFPLENSTTERPYFFPTLPGLSSVFDNEAYKMSFVTRPTLCYEFLADPGPKNYTSALLPFKFPKLRVYFRSDNEGQQGLSKVVLNFGSAYHQVLLPEKVVDMQFQTSQSIQMYNARFSPDTRLLRDQVTENLRSGRRLSAPDINLDIPKWTVEGMEFDGKDDFIKAKYLFTGISFTQSVWGEHQGSTVTYATKQSGKLGAKTGTFSMVYGVNHLARKIAINDPPNAMREFVADAFKMAGKITEAATASQSGMKRIERRPKSQQSSVSQAPSDISSNPHIAIDPVGTSQSVGNDAETFAQPKDSIEASPNAQIFGNAIHEPQVSSILDDTSSLDGHEARPAISEEDSLEKQKRRVESTV